MCSPSSRPKRAGGLALCLTALFAVAPTSWRQACAAGEVHARLVPTTLGAMRELAAGRHAVAISHLSRLRQRPPEIDALVGLIALDAKEAQQGSAKLERAITRRTIRPLIFYWAARAAFAAGKMRLALRRAEQAAAAAPADPVIQMGYALIAKSRGRIVDARRALQEVARRWANIRDPRLYPTPAEGAVALVRSLLARIPHQAHLVRGLAHALWQLDSRLAACELFTALHKKRSDDGDALQMLSRCALEEGRPHRALELARAATKAAPLLPSAHATLGSLLLSGGKTRAAIPELRRAADARPRDAVLLLQLARACDEAQQKSCARRFYRFALRRDASLWAALVGLGLLAQADGKSAIARQLVQRAVVLAPHEPRAIEAQALLAKSSGDAASARRLMGRATRIRRVKKNLEARLKRLQKPLLPLLLALRQCACSPGCAAPTAACRSALAGVDTTAQRFLRAHLALRSGRHAQASRSLINIVNRLQARRLLIEDCKLFKSTLSLGGGVRPEVRKRLLMVSVHRLP